MITPTVGRKVWYFAGSYQSEPHDATVIKVHAPRQIADHNTYVNLLVVDPDTGVTRLESSVKAEPDGCAWRHYEWMPYQAAMAAKAAT